MLEKGKNNFIELKCRIIFAVLIMLSLGLIMGGLWSMNKYSNYGFDNESGFDYIYKLSHDVDRFYSESIEPEMDDMSADRVREFVEACYAMTLSNWSKENGSDMKEELDEYLDASKGKEYNTKAVKLFITTYSVKGSKKDTSPDNTVRLILDKSKKQIHKEYTKGLKKAVRNDHARIKAYELIVDGNSNFITTIFLSHGRTAVLIGLLLLVNLLLLIIMMARDHNWIMDYKWLLILAIVDFLVVFQVMPLCYLIFKAFFPEGRFTFEVLRRLYTYPMNLEAIKNTVIASTATMVLGTLIAFPLAWLVGRTNLYGKKFFRSIFVMTYMIPPYVGAMVWLRLLNPNVGTINQLLRKVFQLGDVIGPLNIYSLGGLVWVLTIFYYPYAFITISRAMERMNPSLEEASQVSGASPLKTLFKITLPMMTPSLIAGALLVFVCSMSCYGIPSIIGAPGKVHTVTTRIIEYNGLGAQGLSDATGLAVFLMGLAIVVLYISDFVVAKKQYITVSGKNTQPKIVDLGKWRVPLTVLLSVFSAIVVFIPFVTILATSFKTDVGRAVWDPENFTLSQWETIFSREETLGCLRNSFVFGVAAATIGIVVACTMSYLLYRTRIRGRKLPDFLITLGSGTPSVVIALSLIMTMKGNFGINIYNTAYIIVIAFLIKYLMMGMRTVVAAMSQIHVSLEECSQISGASWFRTMSKITIPLIFPSIAAGWFLIFIPCFYELSITTLLYSSTTKTIGVQLYEYWTFTSQPQSCALAFGVLMIVIILNYVLNKITNGKFEI